MNKENRKTKWTKCDEFIIDVKINVKAMFSKKYPSLFMEPFFLHHKVLMKV